MFNKFMFDGVQFGHPLAQVKDTAYVVQVQLLSGLDLGAGEVVLDAVGKVVAWRFTGQAWNHWVHDDARAALNVQLESSSDCIGAMAIIKSVPEGWACLILTNGISADEGTFESLSDAIAAMKEWDFSRYTVKVQGYR